MSTRDRHGAWFRDPSDFSRRCAEWADEQAQLRVERDAQLAQERAEAARLAATPEGQVCEREGHDLNAERDRCLRCGRTAAPGWRLLKFPYHPPQPILLVGTVVDCDSHSMTIAVADEG